MDLSIRQSTATAWLVLLLVVRPSLLLRGAHGGALPPPTTPALCGSDNVDGPPPPSSSECVWPDGAGPHMFTGVSAPRPVGAGAAGGVATVVVAPPVIHYRPAPGAADSATSGSSGSSGSSSGSVEVSNAILSGFDLPDPATQPPGLRLRPRGLAPPTAAHLALRDVRVLVTRAALDGYLAFFAPNADTNTSAAVPNTGYTYTDGQSFLHVNSWFDGRTLWTSVGLLVADSLDDAFATSVPPPPGGGGGAGDGGGDADAAEDGGVTKNYVLAADAATIAPQLERRLPAVTPRPLLLYVTSNVTLGKPPLPAAGVRVLRPLVMVGRATAATSVDFRLDVNQVRVLLFLVCVVFGLLGCFCDVKKQSKTIHACALTCTRAPSTPHSLQLVVPPGPEGRYGYVTLDSLVLENLGFGDARSAAAAWPASVLATENVWAVTYDRCGWAARGECVRPFLTAVVCMFVVGRLP
jgi:hypothetical protein